MRIISYEVYVKEKSSNGIRLLKDSLIKPTPLSLKYRYFYLRKLAGCG